MPNNPWIRGFLVSIIGLVFYILFVLGIQVAVSYKLLTVDTAYTVSVGLAMVVFLVCAAFASSKHCR